MKRNDSIIKSINVAWPLPTSSDQFANCWFSNEAPSKHMFCCNFKILCHNDDLWKEDVIICPLDPLTITRKFLQKSPPKTMVSPPNGLSSWYISCNIRSIAFGQCWCCIGTSSRMINEHSWKISIHFDVSFKIHIESLMIWIGSLKVEWTLIFVTWGV